MRRRMLRMWLGLALRAMERAASYSAELLADRHLDDLALAYRILYRAVMGRPAPAFRGMTAGLGYRRVPPFFLGRCLGLCHQAPRGYDGSISGQGQVLHVATGHGGIVAGLPMQAQFQADF